MEPQLPADARQWAAALRLYDEPHGDEFYVIDFWGKYPVWYRLDGSVFTNDYQQVVRPPELVLWAIQQRGWTMERLYARPPRQADG